MRRRSRYMSARLRLFLKPSSSWFPRASWAHASTTDPLSNHVAQIVNKINGKIEFTLIENADT